MLKPKKKSRTLWFNLAMTLLATIPVIIAAAKVLTPTYAAGIEAVLAVVTTAGNTYLRLITDAPLDTPAMRTKWEAK